MLLPTYNTLTESDFFRPNLLKNYLRPKNNVFLIDRDMFSFARSTILMLYLFSLLYKYFLCLSWKSATNSTTISSLSCNYCKTSKNLIKDTHLQPGLSPSSFFPNPYIVIIMVAVLSAQEINWANFTKRKTYILIFLHNKWFISKY